MFWKLVLVVLLVDAMSVFLISNILEHSGSLFAFLGNEQVFSMQLLNPFSSAAIPAGSEEASLFKKIGVEHYLFVKVLGCSRGEQGLTLRTGTVWSHLAWAALEQALLVTTAVFLQGLALFERNGRTMWWSLGAGKLGWVCGDAWLPSELMVSSGQWGRLLA